MRNIKAIFFRKTSIVVMALAFLAIMSLPIYASSIEDNEFHSETDYDQLAGLLSEYLIDSNEITPLMFTAINRIEIYNEENKLIRFGNQNDPTITNFLTKADYLTVIDGVEYYRLNS